MFLKIMFFSKMLLYLVLFALCLSGCNNQINKGQTIVETPTNATISTTTQTITPEPTNTLTATIRATPTITQVHIASSTPSPTIEPTFQTWQATAEAIQMTANAVSQQARNDKETQIAQFPTACENINQYNSDISPNGKWFAAGCGIKENTTMIVQNTRHKMDSRI